MFAPARSALAAALLLLSACSDGPTATAAIQPSAAPRATVAERRVIDSEGPWIFFVFLPCAADGEGEWLRVASRVRHRGQVLSTGQRQHVTVHTTLEATATGLESGATYTVTGREHEAVSAARVDGVFESGTARWKSTLRFTEVATGAGHRVDWISRLVVTPTGAVVVDEMDQQAYCE